MASGIKPGESEFEPSGVCSLVGLGELTLTGCNTVQRVTDGLGCKEKGPLRGLFGIFGVPNGI